MLLRNNINIERLSLTRHQATMSDLKHSQQHFQHGQASILASVAKKAQHMGLGIANPNS